MHLRVTEFELSSQGVGAYCLLLDARYVCVIYGKKIKSVDFGQRAHCCYVTFLPECTVVKNGQHL